MTLDAQHRCLPLSGNGGLLLKTSLLSNLCGLAVSSDSSFFCLACLLNRPLFRDSGSLCIFPLKLFTFQPLPLLLFCRIADRFGLCLCTLALLNFLPQLFFLCSHPFFLSHNFGLALCLALCPEPSHFQRCSAPPHHLLHHHCSPSLCLRR